MIREAKISDLNRINDLGKLINLKYEKLFILFDILNRSYEKIFVITDKEYILGFIHIINTQDEAEIINIIIDPKFQQCGYGEKLLNYAINSLDDSVKSITLEVSANNYVAQNFYEKHNFKVINVRKKYYNDIDGYMMIRWLK